MKLNHISKALLVFLLLVTSSFAETFVYPAKKPVFSITFPNSWSVEHDGEGGLSAITKDEEVEINLWALNQKDVNKNPEKAIMEAVGEIGEIIDEWIRDFELIEKPSEDTFNGIDFVRVVGVGIDKESEKETYVETSLFSPNEKTIFVMMYWGSEKSTIKHMDELVSIYSSMKGVE